MDVCHLDWICVGVEVVLSPPSSLFIEIWSTFWKIESNIPFLFRVRWSTHSITGTVIGTVFEYSIRFEQTWINRSVNAVCFMSFVKYSNHGTTWFSLPYSTFSWIHVIFGVKWLIWRKCLLYQPIQFRKFVSISRRWEIGFLEIYRYISF